MLKKIGKNLFLGIASGSLVFNIIGIIFAVTSDSIELVISGDDYIKQLVCSIIVGIGFWLPSIVYEFRNISNIMKVLIHMGIGIVVYVGTGFYAEWIPVGIGIKYIVLIIISMILIAFVIWSGFYLYYRKEAQLINKKISEYDR